MKRLKNKDLTTVRNWFIEQQGGRCAICTKKLVGSNACLDHNHSTGYIRAVLCRSCNRAEGKIKNAARSAKYKFDTSWFVRRLVTYWAEHDGEPSHRLVHPTFKSEEEKRERRNKLARERRKNGKDT